MSNFCQLSILECMNFAIQELLDILRKVFPLYCAKSDFAFSEIYTQEFHIVELYTRSISSKYYKSIFINHRISRVKIADNNVFEVLNVRLFREVSSNMERPLTTFAVRYGCFCKIAVTFKNPISSERFLMESRLLYGCLSSP